MRRLIMREVGYLLIVRDNTRKNGLFFFFFITKGSFAIRISDYV